MTIQELLDLIAEQTRDIDNVTWTGTDAIDYVNEAVKNTIQRAPQANSKKELVDCAAGIDQVLPTDAVALINVLHNNVANGRAGLSIHRVDAQLKDAFAPDWRRARENSVVIEWMTRSMPTEFMVYPPLDITRKLMIEYSFYPPVLTALGDTIIIHNEYLEAIRNWVMYRTYGRDSEDTPSIARSAMYKEQYEKFFL